MPIIDKTGQKFGKLTVIKPTEKRDPNGGSVIWLCKCDCGNYKEVSSRFLNEKGTIKSCGCLVREKNGKDIKGQRFGQLIALKSTNDRANNGSIIWECKCDCGKIHYTAASNLLSGSSTSCGHSAYIDLKGKRFGKLIAIEPVEIGGKRIWKCKCDCGNEFYARAKDLNYGSVRSCGCFKNSFGENKIINLLKNNNIDFIKEKTFPTCRFKESDALARFDFFIENKYIIEYDGEQHFKEATGCFKKGTLEERKMRDNFKNQWCKENNIPLIRIPYTHLDDICLEDLQLETSKFII